MRSLPPAAAPPPRESDPAPPTGPGRLPPRLVIFDLDDTLCDYAGARDQRLRIAFGQALALVRAREARTTGALPSAPLLAKTPNLEALIAASIAIHPHGTDHFPDLLRSYGVSAEAAASAAAWYRANRFHGLRLFADAVATLEAVRAAQPNRRIGLITNGPADVQRAKIDLLGIEPLLDFALISGELGVEKPDPAIFHEALRRAGATPEEAIFVGDSPDHDIAGARAAGIRAVWMNRTGRAWLHPDPAPEDEVRDLNALLALLAQPARP